MSFFKYRRVADIGEAYVKEGVSLPLQRAKIQRKRKKSLFALANLAILPFF